MVRGLRVRVAASVGIAVHEHGHTAEELLQRADVAMYDAKARRSGHASTRASATRTPWHAWRWVRRSRRDRRRPDRDLPAAQGAARTTGGWWAPRRSSAGATRSAGSSRLRSSSSWQSTPASLASSRAACSTWRSSSAPSGTPPGTSCTWRSTRLVTDLLDTGFPMRWPPPWRPRGARQGAGDRAHGELGAVGPDPHRPRARGAARAGGRPVARRLRHRLLGADPPP